MHFDWQKSVKMVDEEENLNRPRLTAARRVAAKLIKDVKVDSAPIILNSLYHHARKEFDLVIQGANEEVTGPKLDALTKRIGSEIYIIYNQTKHSNRQRFSVAHELGHLYLGHVHKTSKIEINASDKNEVEANHFAAHLLIPPSLLRKDIKNGLKPIELCNKYWVSEEAMWWQIERTGLLNKI